MHTNLILENFNLDPINLLHESCDWMSLYESGNRDIVRMFSEAEEGTTKKNVFQKIWEFIRNALKWIRKRLIKFIQFIKSLFGKKVQKSVDSILQELNVLREHKGTDSINISIPSDENSEYNPPDVKLIVKPLLVKINNDNSLTFTMTEVMGKMSPFGGVKQGGILGFNKKIPINGQDFAGAPVFAPGWKIVTSYLLYAMFLILEPSNIDKLINITQNIRDKKFDNVISNNWYELNQKLDRFMNNPPMSSTVTLEQILKFQSKINEMQDALEIFDTPDDSIDMKFGITNIMNQFSRFVSGVQMGINSITATAAGVYQIDGSYYESIKDIKTLGKFVYECINSSVPPKYIANNVYLVSSPGIKGSKGSANNPIWGQSRVVLFPSDNDTLVYKIALSGWGIRSNKSEYNTYNVFKKNGGEDLLAHTIGISDEASLIVAERVKALKAGGAFDAGNIIKLRNSIETFCKDHNISINLLGDIHSGNVGSRNGKVVVIDYAFVDRR